MAAELKVVWTENSIQDLLTIKEFISFDSPDRAETWIGDLSAARSSLVYRVKPTSIEILTVFEGTPTAQ